MTVGKAAGRPGIGQRDQRRLEVQVLVLQSLIAGFFVLGALSGWFGMRSTASLAGAAWIAVYHLFHAWYILRFRIPGKPVRAVEWATPLLDVSCITTAWVVLDQAQSPFWAVYLYALVGYGRRYHGVRYFVLAGFIVLNVIAGRIAIAAGDADVIMVNADLVTMILITVAVASLSHAVGSAWRSAERRARFLAETDPLTGISNRRVFLERLEALAGEPGQRFAILMLDLDNFKKLNDEFGHIHGDDVLANVAGLLMENIRETDFVARYGGEEFIVAMPETDLPEAVAVAERLRVAVHQSTPTSVSVGCAAREAGEPPSAVIKRADDLLLVAKRTGKNAVRSAALLKSA